MQRSMQRSMQVMVGVLAGLVLLSPVSGPVGASLPETGRPETDGALLPFAPAPMPSDVPPRLQDATMQWPDEPSHLPEDAPNVLIVMLDDVGFGVSEVFGGEIRMPALSRLADEGIEYTGFHTTSICSPTRASLLTGRNHTRVGSGTIAERAVAFDGYTGVIPKNAATMAEVLKQYGYHTAAFGKWHNTPAVETTAIGPKDRWPTGYGFEHFYGFLGGETSQWEPRLTVDTLHVEPPEDDPDYHLTEDLTDQALAWLADYRAFDPDKPFFMYWAPGGAHGPHHVAPQWADRYDGQFDDGWDAYRVRTHQRQLEMGIIPPGTALTPRNDSLQGWDEIPESQRDFQTRLMEIYAGFVEHTDSQVERLLEGMAEMGLRDNTLVIYIVGDNGSSAEGQHGSISELLAQNNIGSSVAQQLEVLDRMGGLDVLGSPQTENMYHAGWAWAGSTPFKGTKLLGAYFGGTRNPMVISWPGHIAPDEQVRHQFHHVVDIAPTLYDILDIPLPDVVNGYPQMPMDGISLAYTFDDADAPGRKHHQFFDNNGSRGLYLDGYFAGTFGPLVPWDTSSAAQRIADWDSAEDVWELYDLRSDFSQARDLAHAQPERLAMMKQRFMDIAEDNKAFPTGAGNWLRVHPEDRVKTRYDHWTFTQTTQRMPEFSAPGVGRQSTRASLRIDTGQGDAEGVLYAIGGAGGGLSVYLDQGRLTYEYNMLLMENTRIHTAALAPGSHDIVITTRIPVPGKAAQVTIEVDGQTAAEGQVPATVPLAFSASETFDVGRDLGSSVSRHYAERRPFAFGGKIEAFTIELL